RREYREVIGCVPLQRAAGQLEAIDPLPFPVHRGVLGRDDRRAVRHEQRHERAGLGDPFIAADWIFEVERWRDELYTSGSGALEEHDLCRRGSAQDRMERESRVRARTRRLVDLTGAEHGE